MLIKELDSHEEDLATLTAFVNNKNIPQTIRTKIETEIKKIRAGIKGQKESAYQLDFYCKESANYFIIHDLRLEVGDRVAQIDHLVLNRLLQIGVCESKNFSEGVSFNENLEFMSFYNGKPQGIESPIEQNNRHIRVLNQLFDKDIVVMPKRLGFKMSPSYLSFILTSNSARITRPQASLPPFTYVIKNDQFQSVWNDDKNMPLSLAAKIVSAETVEKLARDLVAQHKPIKFNWIDKFGLREYLKDDAVAPKDEKVISKNKEISETPKTKDSKIFHCDVCKAELENAVVFWCRKNKEKFKGKLLCRQHQSK